MRRRLFITAACALLLATFGSPGHAEDAKMSADEIEHLLTGNTAEGTWDGTAYKSYFAPDGTTIYVPTNADPMDGKWRINAESGQYESFFAAVGWTGYTVLRTDTGFAWMHDGTAYPFSVVEGRDLEF